MKRESAHVVVALAAVWLAGCARFQEAPVDWGAAGKQFFDHRDGRVHYREQGAGPPVLLVHGFASSMVVWNGLADVLAPAHRCILVDLPGFGLSDKRARDYSPAALADTLVALLDHLGVAEPVDVVAHSWGSSVTLALALRHPTRVRRIVLTSAWVYAAQIPTFFEWARVPGLGEWLWSWFYTEQPGYKFAQAFDDPDRFATPDVEDAIRVAFERPGAVRAALEAARAQRFEDMETRYPRVTQPTLLVWGAEDHVADLAFGERLSTDLPASQLVVLHRCGHMPMVEHPARYVALVSAVLGGAPLPAGAAP